jgi:hypothetical protein
MFSRRELVNTVITVAQTAAVYGPFAMPGWMNGLVLDASFVYGSGGTSLIARAQTSFNNGVTWMDISSFSFTTATKHRIANLRASTPVTTLATPTDNSLAGDTVVDGFLGNLYRVVVTSVGTYAGATTLVISAQPKP